MTAAMLAVMGAMMLGMTFFMHRGHGKKEGRGGERTAAVSTATAAGTEPAEHVH